MLLVLFVAPNQNVYGQRRGGARIQGQRVLRVALKEEPPFVIKDTDGSYYGLSVDLWEMLATDLDLAYEFVEYEHIPSVILALSRNEVDLAVNPMPITGTRLRQLKVTHPFFTSSLGVVMNQKETDQISLFFSNLFSWGFIKLLSLLVMIVFAFGTLVWFVEKKYNPNEFRDGINGIMDGIWWSTVTITTVGYGDKTPKTMLGKIISMVWMFIAISLISSFTATITSKLTLEQLGAQINTIADLQRVGTIGTVAHTGSADYLRKHEVTPDYLFDDPYDGLMALKDGQIDAFVYDKPIIYYLINEHELGSSFRIMPVTLFKQFYSLLMPKDSEIYYQINPEIADKIGRESWRRVLQKYYLDELE